MANPNCKLNHQPFSDFVFGYVAKNKKKTIDVNLTKKLNSHFFMFDGATSAEACFVEPLK